MTVEVWPIDLPIAFLASGYGDAAPDNLIIDNYSAGPPQYRRRTTAGPAPYMGEMFMTTAEWETLSTFFHGTLFDGVMRFQFPPQGTIDQAHYWVSRFISPPMRRASGADDSWLVSLSLERLFPGDAFLVVPLHSETDALYAPIVILEALGPLLTEAGSPIETESDVGIDV